MFIPVFSCRWSECRFTFLAIGLSWLRMHIHPLVLFDAVIFLIRPCIDVVIGVWVVGLIFIIFVHDDALNGMFQMNNF